MKTVVLKPGKDKPIRHRHHWIFSGAIRSAPDFADGDILGVQSSTGDFLGYGYFHHATSISGRMLSFDNTNGEQALAQNIDRAIAYRNSLIDAKTTNAYRLVNSEGDGIPGLVIDKYDDALVMQIATLGIEKLKPLIVAHLEKTLKPSNIYEKSSIPGRREEGLNDQESLLFGKKIETEIEMNSSPQQAAGYQAKIQVKFAEAYPPSLKLRRVRPRPSSREASLAVFGRRRIKKTA